MILYSLGLHGRPGNTRGALSRSGARPVPQFFSRERAGHGRALVKKAAGFFRSLQLLPSNPPPTKPDRIEGKEAFIHLQSSPLHSDLSLLFIEQCFSSVVAMAKGDVLQQDKSVFGMPVSWQRTSSLMKSIANHQLRVADPSPAVIASAPSLLL